MKVVFTTSGDDLSAPLDGRFGRAPKLLTYDLESGTFEVTDNSENVNASQGAGVQAAEMVARTGAKVLVTGHCGPRAYQLLTSAGVTIFTSDAETVAEALELYQAGRLTEAQGADVKGHWA